MTEWRRLKISRVCGGCGAIIARGEPAKFIVLEGLRRELLRCAECAGPVPPDLPALIETDNAIEPRVKMQPLKKTAMGFTRARLSDQDFTRRILGERD